MAVADPARIEARLSALEARVEEVAADASAARHLAAARDRDLADLGVKVDANRKAINALGVQTAARFDAVDARFDRMDARFDAMQSRFEAIDARFDERTPRRMASPQYVRPWTGPRPARSRSFGSSTT